MSDTLQVRKISTASSEYAGYIPPYSTYYAKMPADWTNGTATVGRVCLALAAKNTPTTGTTFNIGGVQQNAMLGFSAGDTGVNFAPPVSSATMSTYNIDAEGRQILAFASGVGASAQYSQVDSTFYAWATTMRPVFRASQHGGMSYTTTTPNMRPAWYNLVGDPETGADTTFNVMFAFIELKRLSSTSFSMAGVWGTSSATTANEAAGRTPAQIVSTCDDFASGALTPQSNSNDTRTITCGVDPSTVFASYGYFCLHNPFSFPLYILHRTRHVSA